MNPRKRRAASHKASRVRCAGTPRPASPLASPATPKRNTQEWQDSRVVHDSRGLCSKKAPSWQDIHVMHPPTAICGAFRIHGAHILPKPARFRMHGAQILPGTGDFPARGHFRDAWSAKPATDCRPGTHRGGILPRQDPRERTAQVYCHCRSGQERIRAQSCHRRTLGNA